MNPSAPFDVYSDTRSQAYGGVAAEAASTNSAVSATADEAVTYRGQVIATFYGASDGGYSESVQNVWGGSGEPYLVGVPDPFDVIAPSHLWTDPPKFTGAQLGDLLGTGGTVTSIDVLKRGVSPRVLIARVSLASGASVEMTGNDIGAYLGLESTWFWVGQSNQPTPKEPPIGGSPTPTPTAAHTPAGSYLVVVSDSSRAAASRRLFARIAHIAPGEQLITRGTGSHRRYLVVAIRVNTRAAVTTARAALRKFGYTSVVMRAIAGDPGPHPALMQTIAAYPTPPKSAPAPAPAAGGLVPEPSSGLPPGVAPAPQP